MMMDNYYLVVDVLKPWALCNLRICSLIPHCKLYPNSSNSLRDMVASIDMAETNYIFYGGCESINSSHSNISIYSLNTLLYTFSLVLTREICLTIKASDHRLATISFIVKILLTF